MDTQRLGAFGGVFALLVFWHFVADWTFQTNKEALAKAKDRSVRFRHCLSYTVMFAVAFMVMGSKGSNWAQLASCAILFISHFVIDSYVPVMLWAKWLRQAPQFDDVGKKTRPQAWQDKVIDSVHYHTDEDAFKAFASTPIGLVLMITIDQLFHIAFLLPVAWLVDK